MSSITPNGIVRFLTGVPCDQNYENSLDFLTKEAQTSYFLGLTPVHTSNNCTRVRDGVIRVDALVETLLPCNYIMFQNTNFGASPFKWFYAFITNIEYVNNNMSYVYYQIDDIQTWMFDVTLKECFVEREHTSTDGLFEHIIDEGFSSTEYVNSDIAINEKVYSVYDAVLFTSYDPLNLSHSGVTIPDVAPMQGNLNGLLALDFQVQDSNGNWYPIEKRDISEWDDMNPLEKLSCYVRQITEANQTDAIVALTLVPRDIIEQSSTSYPKDIYLQYNNYAVGERIDGYLPKNNKLYSSPFCMIEFGVSDGQKEYLQPEYLIAGQNELNIYPNVAPNGSLLVVPAQYRGDNKAWDKSLSFNGFPQCGIAVDGYSAWVASGGDINSTNSMFKGILGGLSSALSKNYAGALVSVGEALIDRQIDVQQAKRLPDTEKGSINTQALLTNQQLRVYQRRKTVNKDMAQSVDEYFTMFGYKVNKVKLPSRRNRPHYTYLKTKGCHIDGGAPADAIQRIEQIYDNGIRFWVNASEVGNYEISNTPV